MLPASWTMILSSSRLIRLVPQPGHRHPLRLHLHSLQQQLQLCYGTGWVLLHQDIVHPVTIALVHLLSRMLHFLKVFLLVAQRRGDQIYSSKTFQSLAHSRTHCNLEAEGGRRAMRFFLTLRDVGLYEDDVWFKLSCT